MARATLARPVTIFECHIMRAKSFWQDYAVTIFELLYTFVQEWLEPFWHYNIVTGTQVWPVALLACKNGSSHSGTANHI